MTRQKSSPSPLSPLPCILAVDTSGPFMSLALQASGRLYRLYRKAAKPHDQTLHTAVRELLKKAGLGYEDLDAVACASGPGQFTGIRIGMAFAAVAGSTLKIPAIAVSRLEAAAFTAAAPSPLTPRPSPLCIVLEGWRGDKFYQLFRPGLPPKPEAPPNWTNEADWAKTSRELAGRGVLIVAAQPRAEDLLGPAGADLGKSRIPPFRPLYLKPAGYERHQKSKALRS